MSRLNSNWREEYLEKEVEELNKRVEELEKENEQLRKKNKANQDLAKNARKAEFEYYKELEEVKVLKERYKNALADLKNTKKEYSLKFNEVINKLKKK